MRLEKSQREAVLSWTTEGLDAGEIRVRAAAFEPPFTITRQQVDYYRVSRRLAVKDIKQADDSSALATGLAVKENRVSKLVALAALLENDLFGDRLWVDMVKGIGRGEDFQVINYQDFNAAEVAQYRGILDDIAREVGDRAAKQDIKQDVISTVNQVQVMIYIPDNGRQDGH